MDLRKKKEACLEAIGIGGDALELSRLVSVMRRPELVQRVEVTTTEYERACGWEEEEDEEGSREKNERDPRPYL